MEQPSVSLPLLRILEHTTSASEAERKNAESQLQNAKSMSGYALALCGIALAPPNNTSPVKVHIRQLAAVLLKQFTRDCWEPENGQSFLSTAEKENIRHLVLHSLSEKDTKVQTALCTVIAAIAKHDWPEQWPTLMEVLLQGINSEDPIRLMGSVQALAFISECFSSEHVSQVVQYVMPQLLRVFSAEPKAFGRLDRRIKTCVVEVVQATLSLLGIMASAGEKEAKELLVPLLPPWMGVFARALCHPGTASARGDHRLQIEIVRTLSVIAKDWLKPMLPFFSTLLPALWTMLTHGVSAFEREAVYGIESNGANDGTNEEEVEGDGEALPLQALVVATFEFLSIMLEMPRKKAQKLFGNNLEQLCKLIITFMQMTQEQMEEWEDNPSKYVQDENEDCLEASLRQTGAELLESLVMALGKSAVSAVSNSVLELLKKAEADERQWRLAEAALLAFESVAVPLVKGIKKGEEDAAPVNLPAFVDSLLRLASQTQSPYLCGRALLCASRYGDVLGTAQLAVLCNTAAVGLESKQPLPVKVSACRAIAAISLCVRRTATAGSEHSRIEGASPQNSERVQALASCAGAIVDGVVALLPFTNDETVHVVLHSLASLVRAVGYSLNESSGGALTSMALALWLRHAHDPLAAEHAEEFLAAIAKLPACRPFMYERVVPAVLSILENEIQGQEQVSGVVEGAVDILQTIVRHSEAPLPRGHLDNSLPKLFLLLERTEDHSLIQSGMRCLTTYMRVDGQQMLEWRDAASHQPGLARLLSVASRSLQQPLADSSILYVGGFITQLLRHGQQALGSDTAAEVVRAVARRMINARMPSLVQELSLVLARLLMAYTETVLTLLQSSTVSDEDQSSLLPLVMAKWTENHLDFYGTYNLKVSTLALTRVLALQHPQLRQYMSSIVVPGDPEQSAGSQHRRKTRSQGNLETKKSSEPLLVRLFVLVLRSWRRFQEEEAVEGEEESDDDEWSSDEDGEGESSFEDSRQMQLSDLLEEGFKEDLDDDEDGDDEEEEERKDAQNDPIYYLRMTNDLPRILRDCADADKAFFAALAEGLSQHTDRRTLEELRGHRAEGAEA